MNRLVRLFGTSIGRKLVMAVTGLALIGFVVVHMVGNLAMLQSASRLNEYAHWLQGHPLIWVARAGLLTLFVVHVVTALSLARENRRARPIGYDARRAGAVSLSARYIVFTGLLVAIFIVFHLVHFTFGTLQPDLFGLVDEQGRHDVFGMVVGAFRNPWFSAIYIVSMLVLGLHLNHGVKSLVQTLGINHDSYNTLLALTGRTLTAIVVVGNCAFPVLVLAGVIGT